MPTITIVFRGLMVFNYQRDYMEIGFINALPADGHQHDAAAPHHPAHIPRILTMKGGILASVFDLRTRPELGKIRNWEIRATNGLQPSATIVTPEPNLNRRLDPTAVTTRDFRWITDLEGSDMHNRELSAEIDTHNLLMVLYVRRGEFYTKMHSPKLKRKTMSSSAQTEYGYAAAVTGCDITLAETAGSALRLMAGGAAGSMVFEFKPGPDTIYEISNSPPDVPTDAPTPIGAGGHFHVYYDNLFIQPPPRDRYDLIRDDAAPSPDPALCGAGYLSRREDPL